MTDEKFETYINEGIEQLPEWVREKLTNVAFLMADRPNDQQRMENELGPDDLLFGLYEGVPLTERGDEAIIIPDTITFFKDTVLKTYSKEEDVRACVHNTVWHEVAHYLGRDEEWVEAEEIKRGKVL